MFCLYYFRAKIHSVQDFVAWKFSLAGVVNGKLKRTMYDFKNSFFPDLFCILRAKYIFSTDMFCLYHFRAKIYGVQDFVARKFSLAGVVN